MYRPLQRRASVVALMVLTFLLVGSQVLAGTTGRLSGTVSDESGTIAGALVRLESPSQAVTATTDAQGRFTFLSLAPDTYRITIAKPGYDPLAQVGLTVQADQSVNLRFVMHKELLKIGGVRTTSASDTVRPGTIQDVYSVNAATATTVQAFGGGGNLNNAYSALASIPGVVVPFGGNGWGQTIFIHGALYEQVGYEFDGIPVNRAFDNYNSNTLSNLGQQELQVVTSGSSADSSASTIAGLINQVIKTGTLPATKSFTGSLGGPASYHQAQLEFGGATSNRLFSYYVGASGYNQDYRYGDQFNGGLSLGPAFLTENEYLTYNTYGNGIYPPCDANGNSTVVGPGGDQGCAIYNQLPYNVGGTASVADREAVANFHIGIPHHDGDGGHDDIQILYSGSLLATKAYDSINDQSPLIRTLGNIFYGTPIPGYADAYGSNARFGQPAASLVVTPYFFPSSPTGRAFNAPIDPNLRDGSYNDGEIFKFQFQKNWEHAYLRVYGYTDYSDRLQNAPVAGALIVAGYPLAAPYDPDYELSSHTRGGSVQFADQLDHHQIIGTLNYVTSSVVRDNNTQWANNLNTPVTSYTDGVGCYDLTTGVSASCLADGTSGTFGTPNPVPMVPVAGASLVVTDPGQRGVYNTVTPKFTTASITDEFRPDARLALYYGARFENFQYDRTDTDTAAYRFWFDQAANTYCYDLVTKQPLYVATKPGLANASPALATGYGNTCGVASASSPTGRVDPATDDPVTNPNGQFGAPNFTAIGAGTLSRNVFEPRIGATFTVNPDTVLRASAGVYAQPVDTATVQYLNLSPRSAATFDYQAFAGFGFFSPTHDFDPTKSVNVDFSLEKRLRGTDMTIKLSPFYRYVKNQFQTYAIGTGIGSLIPTGNETAYGVEFQFHKGDPSHNGFAYQLSYTYTYGFMKFNTLPNGQTVIGPVNGTIDQYNALTSAGNREGLKGAPCYVGGQGAAAPAGDCTPTGGANNTPALTAAGIADGAVVNPYYNQPAQPLYNEGAPFPVYEIFPTANDADGGEDYNQTAVEPHAFSGYIAYRHSRFSTTLGSTMTIGNPGGGGFARYGSPYDVIGLDPRTCSQNQNDAGITTAPNPGLPNTVSCAASLGQYGVLYIPNPQTGHFDGYGEFRAPWLLNLNAQAGYDLSKRVHLNVVLANIYTRCFGGSKTPWSQAYPPGTQVCTYYPNGTYVSNFYNGASPLDSAANGVASPRQNLQSFAASSSNVPFSAYAQLSIKL